MSYAEICEAVERLKKKYGESDPFRLCRDMGIVLLFQSLGKGPDAIKGFYLECKRIKTITVNSDLPLVIQKIIVAHELGHASLHRAEGLYAFHEVAMFDESSMMEKEANLFAAEFLMDDRDVLCALNRDTTFFTAAAMPPYFFVCKLSKNRINRGKIACFMPKNVLYYYIIIMCNINM